MDKFLDKEIIHRLSEKHMLIF